MLPSKRGHRVWRFGSLEINLDINHLSGVGFVRVYYEAGGWIIKLAELQIFRRG
jgi:hypothetical protein